MRVLTQEWALTWVTISKANNLRNRLLSDQRGIGVYGITKETICSLHAVMNLLILQLW